MPGPGSIASESHEAGCKRNPVFGHVEPERPRLQANPGQVGTPARTTVCRDSVVMGEVHPLRRGWAP
ncbi:hypothetical protein Sinac_5486 [Singulisphaera acidiphila DSM 18658]|uniref:Uncharacterized protein n=1 Tax=Singulisphaera acidiphila (strain ATCC BAA-1392 / DSM 18658 / VKM B-2454 / MOB10) TaxID=886293 RepID=L0DLC4_SINAD|nr:hypothetical protein Sinac_5486 [Singulisphaera acidiphila DSM 18658]